MDKLLDIAKINDSQIKSIVSRSTAQQLSSLAEPCYYPDLKKYYYEFLKACNLTEKDIREFTKRRWTGKKESKFMTNMDAISNFYIFLMQYFLKKRDKQTYLYLMLFYVIRQYTGLMNKHFSFCKDDVFKYALETLTKTHLFSREKSISNALYYIAQEMIRRWTKSIANNDLDSIGLFMREARHRVSQSVKSFAQTYYSASEKGLGIQTQELPTDNEDEDNAYQQQTQEKANKLIDDITKKIVIYRYTDRKSQEQARRLSKINSSIATQITSKLNNTKFSDNIRLIYRLYFKEITSMNQICGSDYEKHVRGMMSIKRTKSKIYFKQQIGILLDSILDEFNYKDNYNKLTSQTQFLINLYLAYYLTMLIKTSTCLK